MDKKIFLLLGILLFSSLAFAQYSGSRVQVENFSYTPAPALPGASVDVFVTVKNVSSLKSSNTTVELDLSNESQSSTFPFIVPEGENLVKNIGSLEPNQIGLAKFSIAVDPNAANGNYTVHVITSGGEAVGRKEAFSISILSRNPKVEIIESPTITARPGETVSVPITLKNTGSASAINVLVGVEEDRTVTSTGVVVERQIKPVGTNFEYIERLDAGEVRTISLSLSADSSAELKTHTVPVKIQYQDQNKTDYSKTGYIGLKVFGEPELGAVVSKATPLPYPGVSSTIDIDLFNTGVSTANSIVVRISSTAFESIDKSTIFVGSLEADDFDSFSINAKIRNSIQAGEYDMLLDISYKNSDLESKNETITAKLTVYPSGQGDSPFTAIILLIVVAGIGYFAYRKFRKTK